MIDRSAFFDEMGKLASKPVTKSDAERNLRKLRTLETGAPTRGELLRGAGMGALAGPMISAASKTVAGGWQKGLSSNLRDVAGQAITGAAYGGALPFLRHRTEHGVARKRLKSYAEEGRGGKLKKKIQRTLGKEAGVVDAIKRLALKEVPGTKPWLIGGAQAAKRHAKSSGKLSIPKVSKGPKSKRTSSGAYDVSALASKMGV